MPGSAEKKTSFLAFDHHVNINFERKVSTRNLAIKLLGEKQKMQKCKNVKDFAISAAVDSKVNAPAKVPSLK